MSYKHFLVLYIELRDLPLQGTYVIAYSLKFVWVCVHESVC